LPAADVADVGRPPKTLWTGLKSSGSRSRSQRWCSCSTPHRPGAIRDTKTINVYGEPGQSFAADWVPAGKVIISGRLDCEHHETLIGYQPIVSNIADSIITLRGPQSSTTDRLTA
jgi:hypothetical protein